MTPPDDPTPAWVPAPPPEWEAAPSWDAPPPRRRPALFVLVAAVVVVGLALGGGIGIGWTLARVFVGPQASIGAPAGAGGSAASGSTGNADQGRSSQSSTSALNRAEAAIVDINTTLSSGAAAGTGIVLTSSGQVLTNNHVVDGATSIRVTVASTGHTYDAHVVGVDPPADVALLQLSGASGLKTVKIAPASALKIGAQVIAIGNALGQGGTPSVTQGTITALDQAITATEDNGTSEQLTGLIESDAPISPGDSGGALVDTSGDLLGMITAGQTQRGFRSSTSDIGYAVPAATAMSVVSQIRSGKASSDIILGSSAGYIGVQVRDGDGGVQVVGVESGSPAEQAGIAAGSIITAINGTSFADSAAMGNLIHRHKPGDQITVSWTDADGVGHSATVTLESGPPV